MFTYKVYLEQTKTILTDLKGQKKLKLKEFLVDFWPKFLEAVTMVTEE